jgi:hypothetical protein
MNRGVWELWRNAVLLLNFFFFCSPAFFSTLNPFCHFCFPCSFIPFRKLFQNNQAEIDWMSSHIVPGLRMLLLCVLEFSKNKKKSLSKVFYFHSKVFVSTVKLH